jgi:hypothetical protein
MGPEQRHAQRQVQRVLGVPETFPHDGQGEWNIVIAVGEPLTLGREQDQGGQIGDGVGTDHLDRVQSTASSNAYAERFVLTARTEVTDRMLISGERHLRLVLAEYETHYNGRRPHRSRQLRPPRPDGPVADLSQKRIKRRPVLGGLLNEYERAA